MIRMITFLGYWDQNKFRNNDCSSFGRQLCMSSWFPFLPFHPLVVFHQAFNYQNEKWFFCTKSTLYTGHKKFLKLNHGTFCRPHWRGSLGKNSNTKVYLKKDLEYQMFQAQFNSFNYLNAWRTMNMFCNNLLETVMQIPSLLYPAGIYHSIPALTWYKCSRKKIKLYWHWAAAFQFAYWTKSNAGGSCLPNSSRVTCILLLLLLSLSLFYC